MNSNTENTTEIAEVIQQLQSGSALPAELLEIFSEEAEDHLRTIYDGLNRLQTSDGTDTTALADVRRASHTLKGAAGAVNLQAATKLAHRMEDLLDWLAERSSGASPTQLNLLLATADQLQSLTTQDFNIHDAAQQIAGIYGRYLMEMGDADSGITDRVSSPKKHSEPGSGPTDRAAAFAGTQQSGRSGEPSQFLRVPLSRLDSLVDLLGEMTVNRSEFQHQLSDFESRIDDLQATLKRFRSVSRYLENHTFAASKTSAGSRLTVNAQGEFDQLEFERYNEFHLLAQSISEADNDAEIMSGEFRKIKTAFSSLLQRQQQLNRDAQNSLLKVRMVPLSGIVNRLERTVRTVADKLGKQVELVIEGECIELDKTVLDAMTDPILHLIRNGLDHGIELPAERIAAGKPAIARLKITAINQGTQVTLCVSDDGAGINLHKVREKAIERGLIRSSDQLSDEQLHTLIFRPGFSTASQLTDVSGRGVGMDVVGETIRRLKGTVRVRSEAGIGTDFTIQLPTSVGVSKAVIVEANSKTFAIPMQSIRLIQRLDPLTVTRGSNQPKVCVGDKAIKLIDLATHLQLRSKDSSCFDQGVPMLVVGLGDAEAAITVDAVRGSRDIVVKDLGSHLKKIPMIIGATIDGDGSVIPILDTNEMVNPGTDVLQYTEGSDFSRAVSGRKNLAMVIDDSISVRRVTENLLKLSGWDVVTAKDGVDALETLAAMDDVPDIFLCDMEMPRMDGLELVRQIREHQEFEQTPIVMVTSRASEKHRHKAFEAGATDYVTKPYHDQELLGLVSDLVQSARETVTVG